MLLAIPSLESGRVLLELKNPLDKPMTFEDISLELKQEGRCRSLFGQSKALSPHTSHHIDITVKLRLLFGYETAKMQEKIVGITVRLEPNPPGQLESSLYRVKLQNGRFRQLTKLRESESFLSVFTPV